MMLHFDEFIGEKIKTFFALLQSKKNEIFALITFASKSV